MVNPETKSFSEELFVAIWNLEAAIIKYGERSEQYKRFMELKKLLIELRKKDVSQ